MKGRRALLVLAALLLASASAAAQTRPAPRLCPEDAAPGMRLPDRPGCGVAPAPLKAGRAPGTIEVAPGTTLRIGGRTRLDYDVRR